MQLEHLNSQSTGIEPTTFLESRFLKKRFLSRAKLISTKCSLKKIYIFYQQHRVYVSTSFKQSHTNDDRNYNLCIIIIYYGTMNINLFRVVRQDGQFRKEVQPSSSKSVEVNGRSTNVLWMDQITVSVLCC